MMRVEVNPELLNWAIECAGDRRAFLYEKFPKLDEWESGASQPTLNSWRTSPRRRTCRLAICSCPNRPKKSCPSPICDTMESRGVTRPSPDLLDTIYAMQHRQGWLREDRIECEAEPLDFVGSARQNDNPAGIGQEMRRTVGLVDGWAANVGTWQESLGELRRAVDSMGVAVVVNGIVGNNTHRKLEVGEFRGFALSDVYAPLIFVNGSDAKSAQMFTLAHELAHIWLGKSELTNAGLADKSTHDIEVWCDGAAAEFLVPGDELKALWKEISRADEPFRTAAERLRSAQLLRDAGRWIWASCLERHSSSSIKPTSKKNTGPRPPRVVATFTTPRTPGSDKPSHFASFARRKKGGCRSRKPMPSPGYMAARSRNMPGDWGYHSHEQASPLPSGFRCVHRRQERLLRIPHMPRLLG